MPYPDRAKSTTSVLIADDHAMVREGIRQLLNLHFPGCQIFEGQDGPSVLALIKTKKPNLVILDISMPYSSGAELIGELRRWSPETRILVFTGINSTGLFHQLVKFGVNCIVLKSSPESDLKAGIEKALAGKPYFCSEYTKLAARTDAKMESAELTEREWQILQQITRGKTNKDISQLFNISPKTVDNHRTQLMRKLNVHSVTELVHLAILEGWITANRFHRNN